MRPASPEQVELAIRLYGLERAGCELRRRGLLPRIGGAAGYALTGSYGAVASAGSGVAITPGLGTGESPPTNNALLVSSVTGYGSGTVTPVTPSGWSVGAQATSTNVSATIFYKIAVSTDTAPTIAAATGIVWHGQTAEFSGNSPAPLDQSPTGVTGTSGTNTITAGAVDYLAGALVLVCTAVRLSAAATMTTCSTSLNNGTITDSNNNNSTSTAQHHDFGWSVTTSNSSKDQATVSYSTSGTVGATVTVMASFKLPPIPGVPICNWPQSMWRSAYR